MYDERTEARLRELSSENTLLKDRIARMRGELSAISENIEGTIAQRTTFSGNHPYVGWTGLGLALNEALDERDYLRQLCEQQQETINRLQCKEPGADDVLTREDTDAGC